MSNRFLKHYHAALWVLLIAMLIPMCAAAFYNRPTVDDLYQPFAAMRAVENGEGLLGVLRVGWNSMINSYWSGCGTYMSMFLSFTPPMAAGYTLAWIHPIFFMLFLIGGCFRAAYCVRTACPSLPRRAVHCAALLMSIMLLSLLPSISEGIYWFSGAVNYTFSFALSLYLFSAIFTMEIRRAAGRPISWIHLALLCVGFFLLGGGNFSTATVSVSLFALYVLYLLAHRKLNWTALPALFVTVGFVLAVIAPGNAARQAFHGVTYPIPLTFLRSFHESFQMIFQDMRMWLFALLFVPVIVIALPHLPFEYKHVFLLPLASWALLASSLVSTMYAYANSGADRQQNVHFFLLCFLVIINMSYGIGWARKLLLSRCALRSTGAGAAVCGDAACVDAACGDTTCEKTTCGDAVGSAAATASRTFARAAYGWVAVVAVLFLGVTLRHLEFKPAIVLNVDLPAVKAISYLRDGSLKTYAEEYDHLVAEAKAHPGEAITVDVQPSNYLFGPYVITSDVDDWYNVSFSTYYGCGSIVYQPDDPAAEIHR